jgi:hypothetical protein
LELKYLVIMKKASVKTPKTIVAPKPVSQKKGLLYAGITALVGVIVVAVSFASTQPTNLPDAASYCVPAGTSAPARGNCLASVVNSGPDGRQVTKFDINGVGVDAHDGDLKYFNGKYYLYGTSYGCGYQLTTAGTPFCGFKSYSSTDLVNWTDDGSLFNAATPKWQASCAPPRYGCYRPHVLYNQPTGKYVLWVNSYDNASGFHVLTSASLVGPFVEGPEPAIADLGSPKGGYVNGDFGLFQDDDGRAYINYTDINVPTPAGQATHILKIQALNASFTSAIGPAATPGATGVEAPSLFKKDGTYYMIYGPGCAYCGGTTTVYRTATNPLGSWSGQLPLNRNSCGGQPSFVATLPTPSGKNVYVYGSDLWRAEAGTRIVKNQALANYFWTALTVAGGKISPFSCTNTSDIPTASTPRQASALLQNSDQASGATNFGPWCDITNNWTRSQSFTASKSGRLSTISLSTFQKGNPNAGLTLSVFNATASGLPTGPALYNGTVPPSSISWSPMNFIAPPNIEVVGGRNYTITASSKTTSGCYGWEYAMNNPYPNGTESYQIRGHTGVVETGRDLKFQTAIIGR